VNYLGLIIEASKGIRVDPEKVKAILDWKFKDITLRSALRSFLRLYNYIRTFCYYTSLVTEPLTRLLKKDTLIDMGLKQREAFKSLKKLAIEAPVLTFFRPGRKTKVETDALRNTTGGIIWQL